MSKRHAILFGATGGIGKNLLNLLGREGYEVTVAVRNIPLAREVLKNLILEFENQVTFAEINLANSISVKNFVKKYKNTKTDILIFASGVRGSNSKKHIEYEVNYISPIAIASEFLNLQPTLSIINVTSSAAFRIYRNSPNSIFISDNSKFGGNYAKSKLALVLATMCLSEMYPDSRVISVDPGSNRTKMTLSKNAPFLLRVASFIFFTKPLIGANRIMDAINSLEFPSGVHINANGKIRDMSKFKNHKLHIEAQIKKGFPYMHSSQDLP